MTEPRSKDAAEKLYQLATRSDEDAEVVKAGRKAGGFDIALTR